MDTTSHQAQQVIVGLSGGVDSSVAAILLQQQGYQVEGLFMKNWEEDDTQDYCSAEVDLADAQSVSETLNLRLHAINFSAEYWDEVFSHFLSEYEAGRTPNPDILCNREIKFKAFLDHAMHLGADFIATGHYARSRKVDGQYQLLKGLDNGKDQSYFLYTLGQAQLPPGEEKDDEFFGKIEVYHDLVEARLPLRRSNLDPTSVTLKVGYQGCAEAGICYPPQKKTVNLDLPAGSADTTSTTPAPTKPAAAPLSEQDQLAAALAGDNTLGTILLFFVAGLLLAFTPCVFPMIPILSSIIVGQGGEMTTRKAFILSVTYVLAMALTYTVAGIIAGLFGSNLQAAFQNPWILGTFSAVFVALAFSMFGFYELQLPSAIQSKLTEVSNKQQGGSLIGVAIMGLLSALIVGPCVAPPLMGALIYIGQTGDPWLGGLALFALSMGMGAPLVAIGTAGGKYLPRAGGWMDAVKAVFGVLLLGVAVWMLERILPAEITMLLWALLLLGSAIYMGALEPLKEGVSGWRKLWKMLSLVMLLQGALMLIGLAAGNTDPLQPLKGIGLGGATAAKPAHLAFKQVASIEELEREVAAAANQGKSVMLDFYADWCVSCKEFEKYTFSDPQVLEALGNSVALQADVTANNDAQQALLKRFGLIGPPGIIFYDTSGTELQPHRVVGFMEADEFAAHIRRALGQ